MHPGGFEIDPRIGAATLRAAAASKEDSCPQAILKLHHPSSLDYRARHVLPVIDPQFSYGFLQLKDATKLLEVTKFGENCLQIRVQGM